MPLYDAILAAADPSQVEGLSRLGERASFFVPDDIEERLSRGSRERYDTQFERFGKMEVSDCRLQRLVALIHRHHRGYDQEGYIVAG